VPSLLNTGREAVIVHLRPPAGTVTVVARPVTSYQVVADAPRLSCEFISAYPRVIAFVANPEPKTPPPLLKAASFVPKIFHFAALGVSNYVGYTFVLLYV
jgi:hypothetical protein